jgi:hypothetical protein
MGAGHPVKAEIASENAAPIIMLTMQPLTLRKSMKNNAAS